MNRSNKNGTKVSRSKRGPRSFGTGQPRDFQSTIRVDRVFRFQATAAFATAITSRNLGDSWLVAATATAGFQMAQSLKVKAVELWGPPAAALTPVTVSVDWVGSPGQPGVYGPSVKHSDTSVGATRVAHVMSRAPKQSQVSQWQSPTQSQPLFTLAGPAGTIIDVHLSMVLFDDGTTNAVTNALVGATAGANYMRGLDGLATATSNFVPVSYVQI